MHRDWDFGLNKMKNRMMNRYLHPRYLASAKCGSLQMNYPYQHRKSNDTTTFITV